MFILTYALSLQVCSLFQEGFDGGDAYAILRVLCFVVLHILQSLIRMNRKYEPLF